MKGIITSCFLLATIKSSSALPDRMEDSERETWRRYANDFVDETRAEMWGMNPKTYALIFELREHDILFEKKKIFKKFNHCDGYEMVAKTCYQRVEKEFHDNIIRAKDTSSKEKLCSFWNYEMEKVKETSPRCFHYSFRDTLIEVMARCSFLGPVLETTNYLDGRKYMTGVSSNVEKILVNMTEAVKKSWDDFDSCRQKVVEKQMDRLAKNKKNDCLKMSSLGIINEQLEDCYSRPMAKFEKFIDESKKDIHELERMDPIKSPLSWA